MHFDIFNANCVYIAGSANDTKITDSLMNAMKTGRRQFLKQSAVAAATFTIVPRRVLGGKGYEAPSDQLTKGVVGVGAMGRNHFGYEGTRLLAICDVDNSHLEEALRIAGPGVRIYNDFRELINRADIDIIHIATPPHWHGLIAKMAVEAGKDIWCEKPMTRTIGEGIRLVEAVRTYGSVFRLNIRHRFREQFYGVGTTVINLKKVIDSGVLGWPLRVILSSATGFDWRFICNGRTDLVPQPVPGDLDYDMWLGPAPFKPYHPDRVHTRFRGYWDYDGGLLGDMGQLYLDPVQYMLDKDDTCPVHVEVDSPQQHYDAAGWWRRVNYTYDDGCMIILDSGDMGNDTAFIEGPYGKIFRGFKSDIRDFGKLIKALPEPDQQFETFSEAVRKRKQFAVNELNGHRSCTIVNMGVIALRLGRSLSFDPVKQTFIDDEAANRLINQPMRGPWSMD